MVEPALKRLEIIEGHSGDFLDLNDKLAQLFRAEEMVRLDGRRAQPHMDTTEGIETADIRQDFKEAIPPARMLLEMSLNRSERRLWERRLCRTDQEVSARPQ